MPSYKTMWQEACQQIEALKTQVAQLGAELDRTGEVIDLAGFARHMHVERFTPQQWRQRDLVPPVDFPEIKGEPLWYASTIRDKFAGPTGRLWCPNPTALHAVACDIPHRVPEDGRQV